MDVASVVLLQHESPVAASALLISGDLKLHQRQPLSLSGLRDVYSSSPLDVSTIRSGSDLALEGWFFNATRRNGVYRLENDSLRHQTHYMFS